MNEKKKAPQGFTFNTDSGQYGEFNRMQNTPESIGKEKEVLPTMVVPPFLMISFS